MKKQHILLSLSACIAFGATGLAQAPATGGTQPPPNDWLMWRRTYDAYGFSPLKQINRDTVKNLAVAWSWGLSVNGVYEFTPVEHDGILYVWSHGDKEELGENIQ